MQVKLDDFTFTFHEQYKKDCIECGNKTREFFFNNPVELMVTMHGNV